MLTRALRAAKIQNMFRFPPGLPPAPLAAFAIFLAAGVSSAAQGRYVAIFRDGTRASSDQLVAWPLEFDSARFADRPLFDPANSVRLVLDRDATPRLVGPYVELANGDILPGRVVAYRGDELERPGRFTVALDGWLRSGESNSVEVRASAVARIVGSKDPVLTQDVLGVLLSDGRKLAPRSLRWTTTGLRLLTEEGILDVPFADLVDVVVPGIDRTAAVLADSVLAGKGNSGRLFRLTTREGAALTAPRGYRQTEYLPSKRGIRTRTLPKSFFVMQPAWSFDSIHIPEEAICQCGIRPPDELPLSLLSAKTLLERSLLGIVYPWRRNQAVRGGVLASGELLSDVGIGTHSHSAISFDLPSGASEFSAWVGLDKSVAGGGCVKCRVYLNDVTGTPAWESDFLRGGEEPVYIGPLDLGGAKRLVLVTDFGHENRPSGADPLDIRDEAVWLAPSIRIGLATPREPEWAKYQLSGLSSWQVADATWRQIEFESRWSSMAGRWDPALRFMEEREVNLSRVVKVTPDKDVLEFRTAVSIGESEPIWELRVDGEPQPAIEGRERGNKPRTDLLCQWWDLSAFHGREVKLELSIAGSLETGPLFWRGLSLVSALSNAPSGGKPLMPDLLLTDLEPLEREAYKEKLRPVPDGIPQKRKESIRFLGRKFTGGYGLARDSSVTFELAPEYRKFVAVAGCCFGLSGPFPVRIDDKVVWEKAASSAFEPAQQLSIDIPPGAKELTIATGPEGGAYGFGAFANAGFVKGKK